VGFFSLRTLTGLAGAALAGALAAALAGALAGAAFFDDMLLERGKETEERTAAV
jgi:hypothetical protein